ncbi:hypothetical protein ACP70R_017305 [Stipagrostis hirtigluma subsp. patula]
MRVVENDSKGRLSVGKDLHTSKDPNARKQNMGYHHSGSQDLEKSKYQKRQNENNTEIEEGELIEQESQDTISKGKSPYLVPQLLPESNFSPPTLIPGGLSEVAWWGPHASPSSVSRSPLFSSTYLFPAALLLLSLHDAAQKISQDELRLLDPDTYYGTSVQAGNTAAHGVLQELTDTRKDSSLTCNKKKTWDKTSLSASTRTRVVAERVEDGDLEQAVNELGGRTAGDRGLIASAARWLFSLALVACVEARARESLPPSPAAPTLWCRIDVRMPQEDAKPVAWAEPTGRRRPVAASSGISEWVTRQQEKA